MDEIGPAGWVALGVTGMAAAGVIHAVTGAGNIVRSIVQSPAVAGTGADVDVRNESGTGGWILLSAAILAGGAMYHAAAGAGTILREIFRAASR